MLNYEFPTIRYIEDVLPAIEGIEGFSVVEKDGGYTAINYRMLGNDTFPLIDPNTMDRDAVNRCLIQRECRGLIFETRTGILIGRRFHKFFNVGEREDLHGAENLVLDGDMREKLDGSMVSPVKLDHGFRWMTKAGITTISMQAEVFVARHPQYIELAAFLQSIGLNPIFEWCSRKGRIVVEHPKDRLVLLAVRSIQAGTYYAYEALQAMGERLGIEVVQRYERRSPDMIEIIRAWDDREGVVFVGESGHAVKVKSEWYSNLHKLKESTDREHVLVNIILDEATDDLMALVDTSARIRLEDYVKVFWQRTLGTCEHVLHNVVNRFSHMDRKGFARAIKDYPKLQQSLAFLAYGKANDDEKRKAIEAGMLKLLRKRTTNATSWGQLRTQMQMPEYQKPF